MLIAYDRDDAGNKATDALVEKLQAEGIDCFRILLPKGMDANEYAQQVQSAQKSFVLVIRKAEFMGKGKAPEQQTNIATQAPNFDIETGEIFNVIEEKEAEQQTEIP